MQSQGAALNGVLSSSCLCTYVSYYNYYIHVDALDYMWLCGYNGLHVGTLAGLHIATLGHMWLHWVSYRQLHTYIWLHYK